MQQIWAEILVNPTNGQGALLYASLALLVDLRALCIVRFNRCIMKSEVCCRARGERQTGMRETFSLFDLPELEQGLL